jgi:hypothetical protein
LWGGFVVEPVSLTVGALVAALLTKAAEKGGENLADAAKAAVGRLVGWLRDRFTQTGDEEGSQALAWAEGAPDSPSRLRALAEVVDRRAVADPEFKSQVQRLVDDAKQQQGLQVGSIAQSASGNQNVQTAGNQDTSVSVSYGTPPPPTQR